MAKMNIENVVASTYLGQELDLNRIVEALDGAEYNPQQFPGLVYRLKEPKTATLIFRSGKVVCTGAKCRDDVKVAISKVAKDLEKADVFITIEPKIEVQNIVASSDLDEYLIRDLKSQGAKIDSWGVGTNLITSKDCPSFGGVYKLAATMDKEGNFIPKIKISENTEKITNPGNKTIYRIYDKATGKIKADLICFVGETYDTDKDLLLFDPIETWKKTKLPGGSYTMREILVPVFRNGECVYQSPSVKEIAEYCRQEKDTLWDETKRLFYPHEVHVDLSQSLYDVKKALLDEMTDSE